MLIYQVLKCHTLNYVKSYGERSRTSIILTFKSCSVHYILPRNLLCLVSPSVPSLLQLGSTVFSNISKIELSHHFYYSFIVPKTKKYQETNNTFFPHNKLTENFGKRISKLWFCINCARQDSKHWIIQTFLSLLLIKLFMGCNLLSWLNSSPRV